jgi:hypothetical protein
LINTLAPGTKFILDDVVYLIIINEYRWDEGWNVDVLNLNTFECQHFYHNTKVETDA